MTKTGHRIMIVDDDPDIGIMIKVMLEYKGYTVTIADRAEKVDGFIREHSIELIIMDMLLSGAHGTDICTRLKQDPATSGIPLLMISAHPNAKEICLESGADDFIPKPFDMQDFLEKISRLLEISEN